MGDIEQVEAEPKQPIVEGDDPTPAADQVAVAEQPQSPNDVNSDKEPTVAVEDPPINIRQLTIKNLDTGEEFVIGENDPDFEFDTFAIGDQKPADTEADGKPSESTEPQTPAERAAAAQERKSWWRTFFRFIYKGRSDKVEENVATMTEDISTHRPKTPFTKLSSFKFRKELGKGAFGRVLLAEARTDGQLYALKIISKKNMRSSDRRQAKAERDILHAMTLKAPHPFTSGLKFAFQSENNLYLGMDFIPGGNLRELIKRFKYLPEDWVVFYAAELVLAISHLHSMNVLYRDIKPHNVMIDSKGHVILIDFGLSKQEISHPRGALSLVGTPDYSAPEVLRTGVQQIEAHNREKAMRANKRPKKGKKEDAAAINETARLGHIGYGKAADWWSLGIMIYEMIGGKPTFRGADLRETYQKILYAKLEFVPEERFSPAAKSLLEGLINRDPSLRLGAWENPPRDIMSSPFFASIQWDDVYDRVQDGPWLPELAGFYVSAMKRVSRMREQSIANQSPSLSAPNSPQTSPTPSGKEGEGKGEAREHLVFTPAPMDRYTPISDLELAKAGHPPPNPNEIAVPVNILSPNEAGDDGDSDSDGEGEESEDSRDSEELHIRDSVFVCQENIGNRLPDWSYIDANVLMNYLSDEANGAGEGGAAGGGEGGEGDKKKKKSKMKKLLEEAKVQREKAAKESQEATADKDTEEAGVVTAETEVAVDGVTVVANEPAEVVAETQEEATNASDKV